MAPVRATGGLAVSFKVDRDRTRLDSLWETGGYRLKFPRIDSEVCEAAVVNTGSGVAGGDRLSIHIEAGAGSRVTASTAAAERIYRSNGATTSIDIQLTIHDRATLAWLPQETILFSGSRMARRFEVNLAPNASLVMAEVTVFGRTGSGEIMGPGAYRDQWRVRRGGKLVFADTVRMDGDIGALLARPAVTAGAPVVATMLVVSPDIEDRLERVRSALAATPGAAAVSAWNGMLVMRSTAPSSVVARNELRSALEAVNLCPVPSVWGY